MSLAEIADAVHAECPDSQTEKALAVSTDSRTTKPGDIFFAISGPNFDGHEFTGQAFKQGAVAAVVRKGFATPAGPVIQVNDVVSALGTLAAYHRKQANALVIAVTGSNGKTTTKSMLSEVLSRQFRTRAAIKSFNNEIGVPLTLLSTEAEDEVLVVEIGSNAPGEVATLADMALPDIGVVTSVGYAHLEGLGGLEGVRKEKTSLFEYVRPRGMAIVHDEVLDGTVVRKERDDLTWITFGESDQSDIRVTNVEGDLACVRADIAGDHRLTLGIPGRHNALNAAAVWSVSTRLGMDPKEVLEALSDYRGTDMRLNVHHFGNITLVDDCYNANPSSMSAAIEVLRSAQGGRRILVAGEMAELGPGSRELHRRIGRELSIAGLEVLVTVGDRAAQIAEEAGDGLVKVAFSNTDQACQDLPNLIQNGDTVLVKGSRATGLEVLVDSIRNHLAKSVAPCEQGSTSAAGGSE